MRLSVAGIFFLLFLLPYSRLLSQENFLPGFVIDQANDTLFGEIKNKSFNSYTEKCVFKLNGKEEPATYSPEEIREYQILDGSRYVSKKVLLNGDSTHVFLEYLVDGIVDLFVVRESSVNHYYMEKPGEKPVELKEWKKKLPGTRQTFQPTI